MVDGGWSRRALIASIGVLAARGALVAPEASAARARAKLAAPHVARRAAEPLPLVVLDPGHGGKDPGAIGTRGTYEKHIAFAAAGELAVRLARSGRYRCRLTRTTDRFIPLADRVAIAQGEDRGRGAALFVSMHADAVASSHRVRGASVYTLGTSASDPMAATLAQRENSADRYAGPRAERNSSPVVAAILASLVREETRAGSAHMAHAVVDSFAPAIGLLPNPSRQAAFAVLKAPDIPSVLVEMGFMSNPADEALLRTEAHRARITTAMLAAIDGFFARGAELTHLRG